MRGKVLGLVKSNFRVFVIVGVFALLGTLAIVFSRAATPAVDTEAENGVVQGNARKVTGSGAANASGGGMVQFTASSQTGLSYFVDCLSGSDANSGLTQAAAWKTIAKANTAQLNPGDTLRLKKGCIWAEALVAGWSGTSEKPILISDYGSGAAPHIRLSGAVASATAVKVTGSYQIIENILVSFTAPTATVQYNPTCMQPIASLYGVRFMVGSHLNTLRTSEIKDSMAGVSLAKGSYSNIVTGNHVHHNGIMQDSGGDLGAWGILVNGNNQEISWNDIHDNVAQCVHQDIGKYGSNSIELFEGDNNIIHHNYAHQDRVFSEIGSTKNGADIATGNTYAYNIFVSNMTDSRFIVTRGNGVKFGPVNDTYLTHNSVFLTGGGSLGVSCGACTDTILRADSNIFWAEDKALTASGSFSNQNNIYYSSDGTPNIAGITVAPQWKVNPQFVDAPGGNLRLKSTSPARDSGLLDNRFTLDYDHRIVPAGAAADIGAFEY